MFTSPWQKPFRGMQINKAHPLARGLVGCWVMNEATGDIVFDLSGNSNHGTNNGGDWTAEGLDFIASNSDYISLKNTILPSLPATVICWVQIDSATSFQRIFHSCIDTANPNLYGVYLQTTSGSNLEISYGSGGVASASTRRSKTGGTVTTDLNMYAGVIRSALDMNLYINGLDIGGSYSGSGSSYNPGTKPGGINVLEYASTLYYGNNFISFTCVYNRALSAEEVTWLNREPYAMFQQPISPASLFYEAVGDVSTNLLHGKIIIKDSSIVLVDGLLQIKDIATDLADGKVKVQDTATGLTDGLLRVKDKATGLTDGKVQVKDSATNLADGKIQIKDVTTGIVDGIIKVKDSVTGLADGKVKISNIGSNLADGLIRIKDTVTGIADGKVQIKDVATGTADGLLKIIERATSNVDGKLKIKDTIKDLADGKISITGVAAAVIRRITIANKKPSYRLVTEQPKPAFRLKTENK